MSYNEATGALLMKRLSVFFGFLCISVFGVSTVAAESVLTAEQAREWHKRCISSKPKMNEAYRAQDAILRLSIKVPSGYYLAPKDLSKGGNADLTIVNYSSYISNQCIHERWLLYGIPKLGSTSGVLLVYEGKPRDGLSGTYCDDVASFGETYKVFCNRASRWTTVIHPITKRKITLDGWSIPLEVIVKTANNLKPI